MNTAELQNRVDSSAELSAVRDRVASALSVTSDNRYAFNPLLIIAVISLIIQVIQYCLANRSAEEIAADMKNVRSLPPRKLMRFKRRANVLWKQYCADNGMDPATPNPITSAVYSLGETASDPEICALISLAK